MAAQSVRVGEESFLMDPRVGGYRAGAPDQAFDRVDVFLQRRTPQDFTAL